MPAETLMKHERVALLPPPRLTQPDSAAPRPRPYRPLPLGQALLYFGVPGLTFFAFVWVGIPALTDAGLSEFAAYLWALLVPSALLLMTLTVAFISQRLQNNTPALIVHYLFNGLGFVVFVLLVAGVVEI